MIEIIHADCLHVLRSMPTKSVDLIVADPPYGIDIASRGNVGGGRSFTTKRWDASIPSRAIFHEMLRVGKRHIIWGGNHFTFCLPPSRGWLVWYKKDGLPVHQFADCELAWTSIDMPAQVFNSRWGGFVRDSQEPRVAHPTQKALTVIKWCVSFSKPDDLILDPFLGSGTTAIACIEMGRRFIGIERDQEYVALARRRVQQAFAARALLASASELALSAGRDTSRRSVRSIEFNLGSLSDDNGCGDACK